VSGLLEIMQDAEAPWFSRRQAALTLGRIGAPASRAVPVLVRLLREPAGDPEQAPQLWAIKALALFGPLAADATPALLDVVADRTQPHVARLSALEALGRIGAAHDDALPAIIGMLEQPAPAGSDAEAARLHLERRVAAADVLQLLRRSAAPAVPALIRAANDESVLLRRSAVVTLGAVGQAAGVAVPALADLVLFDESAEVRDLAATALGQVGAEAAPALRALLSDVDVEVRRRAARALGEMGPTAASALDALAHAARDDNALVRVRSLEAMWRIARDAERVLPGALQELQHEDRDVRLGAATLLESLGTRARSAKPDLEQLAGDERPHVRQAAGRVLRSLERSDE
jgi:HEAT repeat protein